MTVGGLGEVDSLLGFEHCLSYVTYFFVTVTREQRDEKVAAENETYKGNKGRRKRKILWIINIIYGWCVP